MKTELDTLSEIFSDLMPSQRGRLTVGWTRGGKVLGGSDKAHIILKEEPQKLFSRAIRFIEFCDLVGHPVPGRETGIHWGLLGKGWGLRDSKISFQSVGPEDQAVALLSTVLANALTAGGIHDAEKLITQNPHDSGVSLSTKNHEVELTVRKGRDVHGKVKILKKF